MRASLLWLLMLSAGCDPAQRAAAAQGGCQLGAVFEVTSSPDALTFDGLALVRTERGFLAVWSGRAGLFARPLEPDGRPEAAAVRLGERCKGGVAAAGAGAALAVACLRPGAHATLIRLSRRGGNPQPQALGPAGRDSRGVALVPFGGGFAVAWHDGEPGRYRVRWARWSPDDGPSADRPLSDPDFAPGAPSLVSHQGALVASWAETRFTPEGRVATRLRVTRLGSRPVELGESSVHEAAPELASLGQRLWIGFRDRRRENQRAQLYAAPLGHDLRPTRRPTRVGRANSDGPPRLVACEGGGFALTPRVYGGEMYIGLHTLDEALRPLGDGHQYYENGREFVRAAGACAPTGGLMLAAERAAPARPGVRAVAVALRCPQPGSNAPPRKR